MKTDELSLGSTADPPPPFHVSQLPICSALLRPARRVRAFADGSGFGGRLALFHVCVDAERAPVVG